jgi:hypothetical protein
LALEVVIVVVVVVVVVVDKTSILSLIENLVVGSLVFFKL